MHTLTCTTDSACFSFHLCYCSLTQFFHVFLFVSGVLVFDICLFDALNTQMGFPVFFPSYPATDTFFDHLDPPVAPTFQRSRHGVRRCLEMPAHPRKRSRIHQLPARLLKQPDLFDLFQKPCPSGSNSLVRKGRELNHLSREYAFSRKEGEKLGIDSCSSCAPHGKSNKRCSVQKTKTQPNRQWETRIPHGSGGRDSSETENPGESLLLDHIRAVCPHATHLCCSIVVYLLVTVLMFLSL